jgi:alpha-glucosidase (family GH31 glycosyl hydrolase)
MKMKIKSHVFVIIILIFSIKLLANPMPKANPAAVVTDGNARFTVLTPEIIRLEWEENGRFEDRASLIFINRNLSVPAFSVKRMKGGLIITTAALKLTYKANAQKFNNDNLSIEYKLNNQKLLWNPSVENKGNLGGTARTLDAYIGDIRSWHNTKLDLGHGVASRDGWSVIKDSTGLYLDDNKEMNWVDNTQSKSYQDWYFFGYGHNYKKAIYDYTQLAGKIPMPPRYVFGYWWSRWWTYSDSEIRDLVTEMKANNIPLDVFVLDMDWHYTFTGERKTDPFGGIIGWTGYTWNKELFPHPEKLFEFFKQNNIKTALNLHAASGVPPTEEKYIEFAKALNIDTSKPIPFDRDYAIMCQKEHKGWDTTSTHGYIPCNITDKNYVKAYFEILLRPIEKQGADFWWLDWQQQHYTHTKKLNNTWWLNYIHFNDMNKNRSTRPLIFHRWGGLGNHRYPIGFSGDALVAWQSLKYQTYFTATAANVGYGYWSHDIGGNGWFGLDSVKNNFADAELFTRWFQFGVFSPVLRTHCDKSTAHERRIWMYKDPYNKALRNALKMRYDIAPYLYNSARLAYDSALSICLPMYYFHPEKKQSYDFKYQYYFGRDMIAAPVTDKMDKHGLAQSNIWLPEGKWFEWSTGNLLKGDSVYKRNFTIDEIPVYVRAGAVIPMNFNAQNLSVLNDTVVWSIFPGANQGSGYLYEDSGNSKEYQNEAFSITKLFYSIDKNGIMKVVISPSNGDFDGKLKERTYIIRLVNSLPVLGAKLENKSFVQNSPIKFQYNAQTLSNELNIGRKLTSDSIQISIKVDKRQTEELLNGIYGKMNRLNKAVFSLKPNIGWGMFPLPITFCEQTATRINYAPQSTYDELLNYHQHFSKAVDAINEMNIADENKKSAISTLKQ